MLGVGSSLDLALQVLGMCGQCASLRQAGTHKGGGQDSRAGKLRSRQKRRGGTLVLRGGGQGDNWESRERRRRGILVTSGAGQRHHLAAQGGVPATPGHCSQKPPHHAGQSEWAFYLSKQHTGPDCDVPARKTRAGQGRRK